MWVLDINAYGSEPVEDESILNAFAENRLIKFTKNKDGTFGVTEMCDEYYGGKLTREQMLALAEEIRLLAL